MGSIFEGISLNHRNVGSRLGTEQKLSASTALRTEASRQHLKMGWTPFLSENGLFLEKEPAGGKSVEQSPPKNWGDCSTEWPSTHYFRSIIQPNYQKNSMRQCNEKSPLYLSIARVYSRGKELLLFLKKKGVTFLCLQEKAQCNGPPQGVQWKVHHYIVTVDFALQQCGLCTCEDQLSNTLPLY
jgi:hypothetical protein